MSCTTSTNAARMVHARLFRQLLFVTGQQLAEWLAMPAPSGRCECNVQSLTAPVLWSTWTHLKRPCSRLKAARLLRSPAAIQRALLSESVYAEYMDGGELAARCSPLQPYSEFDAARIARQVLSALAHLHALRICHTDIKPENILFASRWGPGCAAPLCFRAPNWSSCDLTLLDRLYPSGSCSCFASKQQRRTRCLPAPRR